MNIWHIENRIPSGLRVWRNDNENFQVTEKGTLAALLTNPNYILLDERYSSILSKLSEQLSFHKVKVFDFVLKTENDNYIELNIRNTITPETIQNENSEGKKIWRCEGHVFVSGELKSDFLNISGDDFSFIPGFQFFG